MKKINAFIIGGVLASLCMFACNDDDENAENNERDNQTTVTTSLKGSFLSHSECKGNSSENDAIGGNDIEYKFDLTKGTGTIIHLNAAYSCEANEISTNVIIKGDTIIIEEVVKGGELVDCLCPYDITSQFSGVEKKKYHVQINVGSLKYFEFDMDLTKQSEGGWTKDLNNEEIKGSFLRVSDCKGSPYEEDSLRSAFNDFKASYTFDMQKGVGTITHVNAVYNCCPGKLYTSVEVVGNNITINEINEPDEYTCDCDCTYDLSTQLEGVKEGIYHIKIVDYRGTHSFDIDLSKETEGTFSGTYE